MRVNLLKLVYLFGITAFIALLFFAPFIQVDLPSGEVQKFTFNQLVNGASPFVMAGANVGSAASLPAIPLLAALFLPNYAYTEWTKRRVTLVTLFMTVTFFLSSLMPVIQAASLILNVDITQGASYQASGLWGASAIAYVAMGLLVFMIFTCFPQVRKSAASAMEEDTPTKEKKDKKK